LQVEINFEDLCKKIEEFGRSVFFVSSNSYSRFSFAERLLEKIPGIQVERFHDFQENPKLEDLIKGLERFRVSGSRLIVALGGGTAIDLAKLIKFYSEYTFVGNESSPPEISNFNDDIELVAIPTTFGTGSESTHFAVVYAAGKKYSVASYRILPNYYLIDGSFAETLPPHIKGASCLDALCQAIESYWNKNRDEVSVNFAKEALKRVVANFRGFIDGDKSTFREMAYAANLAGKAINITKTTAPHALSYTLTSHFAVSHGHAVALCIRHMFQINEDCFKASRDSDGVQMMQDLYNLLGVSRAVDACGLINNFLRWSGLETDIKKLGVETYKDLELIVSNTNLERLSNHPVNLNSEHLLSSLTGEQPLSLEYHNKV